MDTQYIKNLENTIKRLICRGIKEHIERKVIYDGIVEYINEQKWTDEIYENIIDIVIEISKKYFCEQTIKNIVQAKSQMITYSKAYSNKKILSYPIQMLLSCDKIFNFRMVGKNRGFEEEISKTFYIFNHIYYTIDVMGKRYE